MRTDPQPTSHCLTAHGSLAHSQSLADAMDFPLGFSRIPGTFDNSQISALVSVGPANRACGFLVDHFLDTPEYGVPPRQPFNAQGYLSYQRTHSEGSFEYITPMPNYVPVGENDEHLYPGTLSCNSAGCTTRFTEIYRRPSLVRHGSDDKEFDSHGCAGYKNSPAHKKFPSREDGDDRGSFGIGNAAFYHGDALPEDCRNCPYWSCDDCPGRFCDLE